MKGFKRVSETGVVDRFRHSKLLLALRISSRSDDGPLLEWLKN